MLSSKRGVGGVQSIDYYHQVMSSLSYTMVTHRCREITDQVSKGELGFPTLMVAAPL